MYLMYIFNNLYRIFTIKATEFTIFVYIFLISIKKQHFLPIYSAFELVLACKYIRINRRCICMFNVLYKVYKGMPKEITYMTFNVESAIKKYLVYSRYDSKIEMWKGSKLIAQYCINRSNPEIIKHDIKTLQDSIQ